MINKVIDVTKNHHMYNKLVDELTNISDDDLVIVAKSYKNRKDDRIKPIAIKNGIYFYVAYNLEGGKTAYLGNVTAEQIHRAKANMMRRARIGTILFDWKTLNDFELHDDLMVFATLDCKMYGGGLLYCREFLKEMKNKIGEYYILPSSIHELIFVPLTTGFKSDFTEMVRDVNATEISEDIYLADRAFEVEEWI